MAKKKRTTPKKPLKTSAAPSRKGKQKPARKNSPRQNSPRSKPTPKAGIATADKPGFAVVGIGASAGGLQAFKQFFSAMPDDTGMAFVLIQHLDPTHESLTAELLARHTRMSVVQVTDEMRVEINHVYVIPPNKYLTISGETLNLMQPLERRGVRVPIDFFLRSLAEDQRERAIGVILSGTGSDGTLGAREIKAAGGVVMVQTPETAQYDGMPRSAIATGVVDYVLPVEKMPEALIRYVRHWYLNGAVVPPPTIEAVPDQLTAIIGILRAHLKCDFSSYKQGTLTRRIQRRMGLLHVENMVEYVENLRQDQNEVNALYKDLLIGVTNFFRDPDSWAQLEKCVITPLVTRAGRNTQPSGEEGDHTIRVWTPGCATGEEAYSIAILLHEMLQEADTNCDVNIFASDIDSEALGFARAGVYPESIVADVPVERLRRFFIKGEHNYRINKDIREAVVFAEQNLISDPPFSKLDLISCRNLLIYLEPEMQKKILSVFHFALREGGYLFLGNSETINQQQELFQPLSRKWRIYRKVGTTRPDRVALPIRALEPKPQHAGALAEVPDHRARHLSTFAQHALLQRFAPACIMVNHHGEILYLTGPVDDFLQLPSGEPSLDVFTTARPGLRTKLRAGLNEAIRQDTAVTLDDVRVKRGGQYVPIRVTVEPLRTSGDTDGLLLVAFDEAAAENRVRVVYVDPADTEVTGKPATTEQYESVVRQLEFELSSTREDLQSTVEELETSNEEFKAANEEVTSINEELQSTNEELETSKEELQSMNEELQTVNSQLEDKVGELESSNNDLSNLWRSIDQATLFLDRALRIRRFTPATPRLLRVIDSDIGRPLSDFAQKFTDEDLLPDCEQVLKQLTPIEKEIQDAEGRWYLRRILPYRTDDDRIDGVVITFTDFTRRIEDELKLRESEERLRQAAEATGFGTYDFDARGRRSLWSAELYTISGLPPATVIDEKVMDDLVHPEDRERFGQAVEQALDPAGEGRHALEIRIVRPDGETLWVSDIGCTLFEGEGNARRAVRVVGTVQDITDRKHVELELERLNRSLEQEVAERIDTLKILQDITRAANEAMSVKQAMQAALARICDYNKWLLGHVYHRNEENEEMVCSGMWHIRNGRESAAYQRFQKATAAVRIRPGEGLIGRVMESGQTIWLNDVSQLSDWRCGAAAQLGLHAAIGFPITIDGKIAAVLEFFSDEVIEPEERFVELIPDVGLQLGHVIERQRASATQARLAAILHTTSAAMLILNLDGVIQHWNEGAEHIFGYTVEEAVGKNVAMLIPSESSDELHRIVARLRGGEAVQDFGTVRLHKDGTPIDVALTVSLVDNDAGQPIGLCGIAYDIRERKRIEQQVAELTDQVRQRLCRDLHDTLGQQITGIAMLAETLRAQIGADSPLADVLHKLEDSAEQAKTQLRAITKGISPVDVDAQGLRIALQELAEETATLHRIACRFESHGDVQLEDNFTATQLFFIASEAVHNAVKHAQAQQITIELLDGDAVTLAVRDDGVGMPSEQEMTKGLGLQIMRHRAGIIGGRLQLDAPPEGGAIVSCFLRGDEGR